MARTLGGGNRPAWTFLTNHAHVLLCLARDPEARLRDVAQQVGVTERAVQRIVTELEEAGYVERAREGRRNTYVVRSGLPLRHPIEQHRTVASLIDLVDPAPSAARAPVTLRRPRTAS